MPSMAALLQLGGRAVLGVWGWFFETPNCIFQILYVVLLTTCYYSVVTEVWPSVTVMDKSMSASLGIAALGLFAVVSFADPGRITRDNIRRFKRYPAHPVLYPPNTTCSTCQTLKIPRSKHCRVCNHCFARFDHHCIWVNTCVAANNYGPFFAFLVVNMAGAAHLLYLTMRSFLRQLDAIISPSSSRSVDDAKLILTDLLSVKPGVTFVACMTAMVWFLVSCLMGCHLSRVYRNCTTNEHFKRQHLKASLAREDANDDDPPSSRPIPMDLSWGVLEVKPRLTARAIDSNPYDLGIVYNIRDALFPPSLKLD
ncbi:hypothetical protein H310_02542 [Aphanomyces invadans]|uniref:Palmitoyltransferase n=1 Tax=Aphanomyces invadans TaxID=157072 RepID=A0A024UIG7_9STRA|nr:hypothetical protein H310_02542 [Aphanomyces invadans]ETW06241.1 hypothetical protein H310_02542 [Aphanomyces invadans]|eukprot:XP_008864316.1 hypothetical protein H310_02542 [Aphanomyces invadans]